MRTSRAVALAVVIAAVAAAAGGYALHRHDESSPRPVATKPVALPSTPAPRDPVLTGLDPAATPPPSAAVAAALRGPVHQLRHGARLVGEVVDVRTGTRLWSSGANVAQPPASTTKLLTAAAALSVLGPQARLSTTARRVGRTVYLVGGGDPTIVRNRSSYVAPTYPRPATLAALAARTVKALGGVRRVRLRLDAHRWSGPTAAVGWKPAYVTEGDVTPPRALEVDEGRTLPASPQAARTRRPVAQAGQVFAALLRHRGVTVMGRPAPGAAPAASRRLAQVRSPTVAALVQRMLTVSDDDLAEALGRAVAIRSHRTATFAGAARAVTAAVRGLGVDTRGVSLHDTSGLSHRDRIPPRTMIGVLRAAASARHRALRPLLEGLPVAGLTGTLSGRYLDGPSRRAAGVARAKTGTLTGVDALAGVVVDRGGRLLAFAFLASRAPSPGVTVPQLDRLAARLASCGVACR